MIPLNIIDRIYFAGERLYDLGGFRRMNGPSAIVYVLTLPFFSLLNKLHEQNLLPFNKKFALLYILAALGGLYFCVWLVYIKRGRHERVMNYYSSKAIDTRGYHYFYIVSGIAVGLVIAIIITKYSSSFPPKGFYST